MELTSEDYKQHCAEFYKRFMACALAAQEVNSAANYNFICRAEMKELQTCADQLYVQAQSALSCAPPACQRGVLRRTPACCLGCALRASASLVGGGKLLCLFACLLFRSVFIRRELPLRPFIDCGVGGRGAGTQARSRA